MAVKDMVRRYVYIGFIPGIRLIQCQSTSPCFKQSRNKSCQRTSSPAKSIGGNLHRFFSGLGESEPNVKIDVL